MQHPPLRIVSAYPTLGLPRPVCPHNLLCRAVLDLNDGATRGC